MRRKIRACLISAALIIMLCAVSGCRAETGAAVSGNSADIKIGVVYNGDPSTGNGYSFAHEEGIRKMREELGLKDQQIISRISISEKDIVAIDNALMELINSGCSVIFATSYGYMEECRKYSAKYPDIIFSECSGKDSNGSNFTNYFGRLYEARYISGIVAGLNTRTDRVGFVAAKGLDSSEVTGSIDAFAMGVNSVNEKCRVIVSVTGSWNDSDAETAAAVKLVNSGCDVIAQHCDTPAAQVAAARAGAGGIGYNSDMSRIAPESELTSVVWNWSAYYTRAVRSIMNGTWDGSNYYGGTEDNIVGITPLSEFCADGTQLAVDRAEKGIKDGSVKIFYGKIETNDGSTVGTAGQAFTDECIKYDIDWYYKNVVVY